MVELNRRVIGWGSIRGDRLEGLYTDPEFAGHGIGTELLVKLEGLMRARDIRTIHSDVSPNAEGFYRRRGYEPVGPRRPDDAQPVVKQLT